MWTGTDYKIVIVFIRHGETSLNEQRRYISFTDASLSEQGAEYIKSLRGQFATPDMIFTSSLKRTGETAKIIFGSDSRYVVRELDEINFGIFEGKTYEELKDNKEYISWLDSGCIKRIPGGESREEFIKGS